MGEVLGTIALLALIGLGVWLFGPFALRVGGVFIALLGVFGLLTGTSEAVALVVTGVVAWGAGTLLRRLKQGVGRRPRVRAPDDGAPDGPCVTGKVQYVNEEEGWEVIAANNERYDSGLVDYRLQRLYACEFCGWLHATSQDQRTGASW